MKKLKLDYYQEIEDLLQKSPNPICVAFAVNCAKDQLHNITNKSHYSICSETLNITEKYMKKLASKAELENAINTANAANSAAYAASAAAYAAAAAACAAYNAANASAYASAYNAANASAYAYAAYNAANASAYAATAYAAYAAAYNAAKNIKFKEYYEVLLSMLDKLSKLEKLVYEI
jgi:hypothetical protein